MVQAIERISVAYHCYFLPVPSIVIVLRFWSELLVHAGYAVNTAFACSGFALTVNDAVLCVHSDHAIVSSFPMHFDVLSVQSVFRHATAAASAALNSGAVCSVTHQR